MKNSACVSTLYQCVDPPEPEGSEKVPWWLGAFSKGFRGLLSFDHCYYFSLGYYDKMKIE